MARSRNLPDDDAIYQLAKLSQHADDRPIRVLLQAFGSRLIQSLSELQVLAKLRYISKALPTLDFNATRPGVFNAVVDAARSKGLDQQLDEALENPLVDKATVFEVRTLLRDLQQKKSP